MTNKMIRTAGCVAASFLMVLMTAAPSQAQGRVRVNIPFSFDAGTESLPAGQYVFERTGLAGTSLMRVASVDRNETLTFVTLPVNRPSTVYDPRLVFEILDGSYRLAEVWTAGAESGGLLPRTKEQALIAKREGKVKTIALALRADAVRAR